MSQPTLQEQFAVMAQRFRDDKSVEEVQQIVVESAVALIDGCDRAAIGVLGGSTFRSAAATDVMRLIDDLQNDVGEGPCLEASTDAIAQMDDDITHATPWPQPAAVVVARTPVRAMLAVPLIDAARRRAPLCPPTASPKMRRSSC